MLMMLQDIKKLKFLDKFDTLWLGPFVILKKFPTILSNCKIGMVLTSQPILMGVVARNTRRDVCMVGIF